MALETLCDDALYWVEHRIFSPGEIAIRFNHGIVSIDCFPNGNGRHIRLMADVVITNVFNFPLFSWGSRDLVRQGETRSNYLKAIKAADKGVFDPLLQILGRRDFSLIKNGLPDM